MGETHTRPVTIQIIGDHQERDLTPSQEFTYTTSHETTDQLPGEMSRDLKKDKRQKKKERSQGRMFEIRETGKL